MQQTQIRRLKLFVRFPDFPQMWHFADLRIVEPIFFLVDYRFVHQSFFADLKLLHVRTYILFSLQI